MAISLWPKMSFEQMQVRQDNLRHGEGKEDDEKQVCTHVQEHLMAKSKFASDG
jgi:hypothetical protein